MSKTKAFYITLTTLLSVVCIAGIVLLSMPKVQASLIKNSNEYNEILDINSTQNDHISNLNGLIDDLNNQIDSLKSNLSNLENQRTNLENQITNLENLYNEGLISIAEKDIAISELNAEILQLSQQISTLEDQVNNLSLQLETIFLEKIRLEGVIESQSQEISSLQNNVNELTLQFNSLYEAKAELDIKVEDLNKQIAVLENDVSSQSDYINSLLLEKQKCVDEITLLEAEITDYLNQIASLQQEIKELKSSVYQDAKFTTLDWVFKFDCIDDLGIQSTYYVGDYMEEATTKMHIEQIKFLYENYQTITFGSLCGLEVTVPLNHTFASTKIFVASNDKPLINDTYKATFKNVYHNVRMWDGYGYDFVNIDELDGFYNVRFSIQLTGSTANGIDTLDLSFNLDVI